MVNLQLKSTYCMYIRRILTLRYIKELLFWFGGQALEIAAFPLYACDPVELCECMGKDHM